MLRKTYFMAFESYSPEGKILGKHWVVQPAWFWKDPAIILEENRIEVSSKYPERQIGPISMNRV